jgi:hypothetical protein
MEFFLFVRFFFGVLFVGTLVVGYFLYKNYDRMFGPDPAFPGETGGARSLNKTQVFVIWLHFVLITGGFAFCLH